MAWVQKGFLAARRDGRLVFFIQWWMVWAKTCPNMLGVKAQKSWEGQDRRVQYRKIENWQVQSCVCHLPPSQHPGPLGPFLGMERWGGSLPSWQTSCQCTCQPPSWQPPESCASHPAGQSRWQPSSQETGASWAWWQNEAKFSEKCWWCLSLEMHKWNAQMKWQWGYLPTCQKLTQCVICFPLSRRWSVAFPVCVRTEVFKSFLPRIAVQISSLRKCGLCSKWRHHNIRLDIHKPAWLKWNLGNTRVSQKKLG